MPGQDPDPGPVSPDANSTPAFARLGLRTPAGWGPLPSEQPLPPPVIPDYSILRRIGGGAYGEVWLARNFTGSHLAIKVVHRCLFDHDRPYERELAGIRRFEPISRSHPSQVAIHHVGQNTTEGYFYYVMDLADDANAECGTRNAETAPSLPRSARESPDPQIRKSAIRNPDQYVPKTLKHLLRTRGRLLSAECLDVALALATALEHLHGHGLVHRDIKPSNVIFVGGVPKLADIGLVTSIDATQSFVGTEGFFPPEGPGTAQADIFSLGKLFYEMATGKDRREFPELPTDLPSFEEQDALSELNAIVLKACQHDPGQRYATATALRLDLERLQRGRSIKRQRAWQRRWTRVRKIALPATLSGVAVLAIVALLKPRFNSDTASLNGRTSAGPQARTEGGANPAALDARAVFVLPIRPAETNGAPADLCSRITDAFIDSLALLKDQGITVGPRKSGWAHLPESELFQRVTNEFRMRHALIGRVALRTNLSVGVDVRRLQSGGQPPDAPGGQSLVTSTPTPTSVGGDVRRLQSKQSPESESRNPEPASSGRGQSLVTSTPTPTNVGVDVRRLQSPSSISSDPGLNELTGDRYELALTLHDLQSGQPRWSETFRGGTNDLIEMERRALAKLVGSLGGELTQERAGQISRLLSNNLEALRWLIEAQAVYDRKSGTQVGYTEVLSLANKALDLDPLYLDADFWVIYILRSLAQDRHPAEIWGPLRKSLDEILARDETHLGALDQRAGYSLYYDRDWEASDAFQDRLYVSVSEERAHFHRAYWFRVHGWFEQARVEQDFAEHPEPTNPDIRFFMASSRWLARQYDEGIQIARRTLEIYPGHAEGHFWLAHCLVAKGDYEPGIQAIEAAQKVWKKQEMTALLGVAYAGMGLTNKAQGVLKELRQFEQTGTGLRPYFIARVYAALGQKEEALDWLEKAEEERSEYLYFADLGGLRTDLAWDCLHNEPRYWALCDKLGLGKDQWPRKVAPRK
jgi:tetratricopeptide (TPR) repeat protein